MNILRVSDFIDGFEGLGEFLLLLLKIIGFLCLPLIWFIYGFYEIGYYFFIYKKKVRDVKYIKHIRKNAESVHKSHFHPCWGIWLGSYLACRYCKKILNEIEEELKEN